MSLQDTIGDFLLTPLSGAETMIFFIGVFVGVFTVTTILGWINSEKKK